VVPEAIVKAKITGGISIPTWGIAGGGGGNDLEGLSGTADGDETSITGENAWVAKRGGGGAEGADLLSSDVEVET